MGTSVCFFCVGKVSEMPLYMGWLACMSAVKNFGKKAVVV